MRFLLLITCLVFVLSLFAASPLQAKGGRGGRARHGFGGGAVCNGPHCPNRSGGKYDSAQSSRKPTLVAGHAPVAENKKQKQLVIEQQHRDKRIAQAEHLRAIAERNGNENLAANADRKEAAAHDHYARRAEQLEKFGVTDPTHNPDDGPSEPLLPGVVDPPPEVTLLDLLP